MGRQEQPLWRRRSFSSAPPRPTATAQADPEPAPPPSEPASPPAGIPHRDPPKTTIDADGTYAVGKDIQPGVYSSAGPVGDGACYWKRVNGTNIVDNAMSKKAQIVQIDADRYGVHDERVPALAADRRPRARPEVRVICSANWPNWRRSSPATPGGPRRRAIPDSQRIFSPYTRSTVIAISTLRSDTITARYSSQSGCSPAALR